MKYMNDIIHKVQSKFYLYVTYFTHIKYAYKNCTYEI